MLNTLEIIIDESIYNYVQERVRVCNKENFIIAKAVMSDYTTRYCFFYHNADTLRKLEKYIKKVNKLLGSETVPTIVIHDSIFDAIAKDSSEKPNSYSYVEESGKSIIDKLNEKYKSDVKLCSYVVKQSKVISNVPTISRKEYLEHRWQECSLDEIKKDEILLEHIEVANDRNFNNFENLINEILILQLVRYWVPQGEVRDDLVEIKKNVEADIVERLSFIDEKYQAYQTLRGYPKDFCENEKKVVKRLLDSYQPDDEDKLEQNEYEKYCKELADILRNLNIQG